MNILAIVQNILKKQANINLNKKPLPNDKLHFLHSNPNVAAQRCGIEVLPGPGVIGVLENTKN